MNSGLVSNVVDFGIAVNIAVGHIGEMSGKAIQAAAKVVGYPMIKLVGQAVEAAGRAWSDSAVKIGNRDRRRLTKRKHKPLHAEFGGTS